MLHQWYNNTMNARKQSFFSRHKVARVILPVVGIYLLICGIVSLNDRQSITPETKLAQTEHVLSVSDISKDELLELTNEERAKVGLNPLTLNTNLEMSAKDKCDDMVKYDYWSHDTPGGEQPWSFIKRYTPYYKSSGENLGYGFKNAKGVIEGWMNSPTHKSLILDSEFSDVGIDICYSNDYNDDGKSLIVVQHFANL